MDNQKQIKPEFGDLPQLLSQRYLCHHMLSAAYRENLLILSLGDGREERNGWGNCNVELHAVVATQPEFLNIEEQSRSSLGDCQRPGPSMEWR